MKKTVIIISILYILWGLLFFRETTFVTLDGERNYCLFDDAMISMRYALNIANGQGPVWNEGEKIEGYSNPLWVIIMTIPHLLFSKKASIIIIQLLGIITTLLIALLSLKLFDAYSGSLSNGLLKKSHGILYFVILFYYPFNYWSILGMESGLVIVLVLLAVLSTLGIQEKPHKKNFYLLSLLSGLLLLTRNDNLLPVLLLYSFIYFSSKNKTFDFRRSFFISIFITIFILLLQIAFRYFYYGKIIPNSFLLKISNKNIFYCIHDGIIFIKDFTISIIPFFIVVFLRKKLFKENYLFLFLMIIFLFISYQVWVGGDAWGLSRFLSAAVPFITILFFIALAEVINKFACNLKEKYKSCLLIAGGLIFFFSLNADYVKEICFLKLPYQVNENKENVNTALLINEFTDNNATVGVFWAGAISYYTERKTFDFLGKCDPYIANLNPYIQSNKWYKRIYHPGHDKVDLNYSILKLKPTYIQYFLESGDVLNFVEKNYIAVNIKDSRLHFLKDSPNVRWNKLKSYKN